MNKAKFLSDLNALLYDLAIEERTEAMSFYTEYFEEAGEENEADVIRELGSPNEVSFKIHEELAGKELEVYSDTANQDGKTEDSTYYQAEAKKAKSETKGWMVAFWVLLGIITAPITIPLAIAAVAVMIGLGVAALAVVFALCVTFGAVTIALLVVAVFCLIFGFMNLIASPMAALILIGSGLISAGLFLLGIFVTVKALVVVLPAAAKGIWKLLQMPFKKTNKVKQIEEK